MKSFLAVLTLLTSVSASATSAWEHFSSGDGTAFEERWVVTGAKTGISSNETLASDMYLGAGLDEDGDLFLWVKHRSSELCKFSDWKLAVDKTVISVNSTLGEDTEGTALFPVNDAESTKLLKLFREGERVAVRFHANCDNMFYVRYIGSATMTYSLNGSSAALEFLTGAAPKIIDGEERQSAAHNSGDMMAYQHAIANKIQRSWAMPASVTPDTECIVIVRQTRNGDVISADIVSCNGNDAVRRSVEAAVRRASPLPLPENPQVFQAELRITLRPDL